MENVPMTTHSPNHYAVSLIVVVLVTVAAGKSPPANEGSYAKPLFIISINPSLVFLSIFANTIYNIFFHPLSSYPGSALSTASDLIYFFHWVTGNLIRYTEENHRKYGPVVRLAPNRLSYIGQDVWRDIYGHKTASGSKVAVIKDPQTYGPAANGRHSLLSIFSDAEHGRLRKIFSHGFSDRALKAQEPLLRTHVNKLIRNIDDFLHKSPGSAIDFVKMFNSVTFDIIGELTFGESLGLLDGNEERYKWVESINENLKLAPILTLAVQYPILTRIVKVLLPRRIRESGDESSRMASDLVEQRLAKGKVTEKPDFWTLVLNRDEEVLDKEDMVANADLFMAAGSETTATMLSGLMYNLLTNPSKLQKVVEEVRSSFTSGEELTIENTQRLKYLSACFEESMRLYPSTPLGPPRVVMKGGGLVGGKFVPEKTTVFLSSYSAYRSPLNFKDPESFIPERWLASEPLYTKYVNDQREVFQPFSYGPRNCIGRNLALHEMRLIAVSLLYNFDFQICEASRSTWINQKMFWALWNKPPLWLKVTRASQS